jgi:hypothetical protein
MTGFGASSLPGGCTKFSGLLPQSPGMSTVVYFSFILSDEIGGYAGYVESGITISVSRTDAGSAEGSCGGTSAGTFSLLKGHNENRTLGEALLPLYSER